MSPSLDTLVPIGFAALLLLILAARPWTIRSTEGKVLALLALLIAPALAAYGGIAAHLDRSRSTSACLSCHVMSEHAKGMREPGSTSLPAVHYQNRLISREEACFSCHSDYGYFGDDRAKARGVKHVITTYFGTIPDTLRMARRYRVRECLHCHAGARSFEEAEAHRTGRFTMEDIKAGKASCTRSGCHDVVHREPSVAQTASLEPFLLTGQVPPMRLEPKIAPLDSAASRAVPPDPPSKALDTPPIAKLEPVKVTATAPKTTTKATAKTTAKKTTRSTAKRRR